MALPQAQIPSFSLGATPTSANLGQGISQGINQGMNYFQTQQQIQQKQQELNMAKQKMLIEQADTLLRNGLQYPDALLPVFWPQIASTMNQVNPQYKLDPNNPPQDIKSWGKTVLQAGDALTNGVINPMQADAAIHAANDKHIQAPMPGGGSQPPQPPPQGQPPQGGGMPQGQGGMPQGQGAGPQMPPPQQQVPPQAGGQPSSPQPQQPPEPLSEAGQKYTAMYQAAMSLPPSQIDAALSAIKSSPEALEWNAEMEERRQLAQNAQTHQLQLKQNMMGNFNTESQAAKQVGDNYNVFNGLLGSAKPANDIADKQEALNLAAQEKTAMMPMMQMIYAGSARPGSPEWVDELTKTGDLSTLAQQALKRVFVDGQPMTGSQIKAMRTNGLSIFQSREQQQTQLENSFAQGAQNNGIDPRQIFSMNPRPANAVSTSQFFPTQSTDQAPLIGHTMKTDKGDIKFLGGTDVHNPNNWTNPQ